MVRAGNPTSTSDRRPGERIPLAVLVATFFLFALWGAGHRLYDTLLPQFARVFSLHGLALAMAGGVYSISYFVWALPAALCARRFGYKTTIVFGLGIACIGAFLLYPAGVTRSFAYFLVAASVMSLGWVLLEVSANPLVMGLGSAKNAVQRLNLAQFFYVPGTLIGLWVAQWLIRIHDGATGAPLGHSIAHPYIVFAAVLLLMTIVVEDRRYPPLANERVYGLKGIGRDIAVLLARPLFAAAVIAQGMNVIAMAATWTIAGPLLRGFYSPGVMALWGGVWVWVMVLFGVGRLIGAGLMSWISPERLMAGFSFVGLVAALVAMATGGPVTGLIVLATNLTLSILWPTILGLAVKDLGPLIKIATALICMGGALGGFVHRLISAYVYQAAPRLGLIAMAAAYTAMLAFALACRRANPETEPH